MHPPFGFSLFFLRSVAAREPYKDRVTGAAIAPITTGQIYWGAVPFVCIQVIMIALTIAFPGMVTRYKDETPPAMESAPTPDANAPDFNAAPNFGGSIAPTPQGGGSNDTSDQPNFGGTPQPDATPPDGGTPNFGATPAQPDTSQPDPSQPAAPNFGG
jgi:hypothetical protein